MSITVILAKPPPNPALDAFIDEFSHVKPDGTLLCTIDTTPAMKARLPAARAMRAVGGA